MDRVSKPLLGVLIATVAVLALWVIALKPSSSSKGPNGNGGGLGQFQSAINKAHGAVQTSNADNARSGQVPTTTSQLTTAPPTVAPATGGASAHSSSSSSSASRAAQPSTTTTPAARAARFTIVKAALDAHKAVALLFYNPPAADDQAVKQELAAVPTHRGRVVKVAVPLTELPSYTAVTQQVPVNMSPTLVVIARNGQAGEVAGFADKVEIAQRVADALATSVGSRAGVDQYGAVREGAMAPPLSSRTMDTLAFEHHLTSPQGHGRLPDGGYTAAAGGAVCCDRIELSAAIDSDRVRDVGFIARGCGAATAAGSAAVTLARGRSLLEAARIGPAEIARELGGLSPAKLHAAELASDALARALGAGVRELASIRRPSGTRTLVALSGGVDSAVAALLSAEGGETVAVTLELWADPENDGERSCCSASAVAQARSLAHSMGLAHFTLDLRAEFRAGVVDPFISGYAGGETPNPCVGCNGHVRLDAMLALADRLGCDSLATGHYARVAERGEDDGPLLRVAADLAKDQTYMLAALSRRSLERMRFPLGELTKPEVRKIAAAAGLPVAAKVDSQDLCFLAGTDRARFLARHGGLADRPGHVVDRHGRVLARHRGHHRFTVGQRRGLGVASDHPLYVLDKDAHSNRVTVGSRAALLTDRVPLRGARLHRPGGRVNCVKLRYRSQPLLATLVGNPGPGSHPSLELHMADPVEGAAPGQLACLMDGELVVGWGTITRRAAPPAPTSP